MINIIGNINLMRVNFKVVGFILSCLMLLGAEKKDYATFFIFRGDTLMKNSDDESYNIQVKLTNLLGKSHSIGDMIREVKDRFKEGNLIIGVDDKKFLEIGTDYEFLGINDKDGNVCNKEEKLKVENYYFVFRKKIGVPVNEEKPKENPKEESKEKPKEKPKEEPKGKPVKKDSGCGCCSK